MSVKPRCVFCPGGVESVPCSKGCRIRYLLDRWEEIFDPSATSQQGSPGDGSGIGLLPAMSHHPSVLELSRCLAVLRVAAPVRFSHLMAFHRAEWRVHRWSESRRRRGGKSELVDRAERQRLTPSWVRLEKVRSAQLALATAFRGDVSIPDELWDALTLSAEDAEAKRLRRRARVAA